MFTSDLTCLTTHRLNKSTRSVMAAIGFVGTTGNGFGMTSSSRIMAGKKFHGFPVGGFKILSSHLGQLTTDPIVPIPLITNRTASAGAVF